MSETNDPLGEAIIDFSENGFSENIIVHSDLCDDDILPVEYLFRTYTEMPNTEQKALDLSKGSVLEVGGGTGCHASYLKSKGLKTFSIDTSKGAIDHMKNQGLQCSQISFLAFNSEKFDTILILMNGLGLSGELNHLGRFLSHAKSILKPDGFILADSSDIRYLYEDEEGGTWIDLNGKYPGEMSFQMEYKAHKSEWFSWLYVDFETLEKEALKIGLSAIKIMEDENFHYLTKLEVIK